MKYFKFVLLVTVFSIIQNKTISQDNNVLYLNQGWNFIHKDSLYNAKVPGNIFLDLFLNEIIDNPYIGNNENEIQWVSTKNWEYNLSFNVDSNFLNYKNISLVFEGLDTYAEVYLNNKPILKTNNMFRRWVISTKNILLGENKLKVVFFPPLKIDSLSASANPYKFPDSRSFTRKAPYQYGWDWGPKLVGVGIWKEVYLEGTNDFRINDIYILQKSVSPDIAKLKAKIELNNYNEDSLKIEIYNITTNQSHILTTVPIDKNKSTISFDFEIKNPKLWWPNGMGEQNLHEFYFSIKSKNQTFEKDVKIGLRTVQLIQNKDKQGESFYFEVNGKPIFIKGANYIPQDNFPSIINSNKYEKIIQDVVKSNMNMLRVWGGGIYENDMFYNICDKYGILIWQDFMFACNFYPGDSIFLNNVKIEAQEQIFRLRNHPSIALWCGNNEIDEAWHNWGYQKSLGYNMLDSTEIWNNYKKLFHNLLPKLIHELSPNTSYISTSPKIGWGHEEALYSGDMHYWGVWWGAEPFEIYNKKIGRFMSEYGFQGLPDINTLIEVLDSSDLRLDSPAFLNHQKHPRGMQLIDEYMERDFPIPKSFTDYIYMSQLVQAHGINIAIEAHRRAKPYCMGTLYWQLNDSWPSISWSGIDYYGRWKALQYNVKKTYKKVIVSSELKNDILKIFVISDSLKSIKGYLDMTLLDFDGNILHHSNIETNIDANESKNVISFNTNNLIGDYDKCKVVLNTVFQTNKKKLAFKNIYFVKPKELKLKIPTIKKSIKKIKNKFIITLSSNTLVKNLYLKPNFQGHFSNNYFDILPNTEYEISFDQISTYIYEKDSKLKIQFKNLNKWSINREPK